MESCLNQWFILDTKAALGLSELYVISWDKTNFTDVTIYFTRWVFLNIN